MKDRATGDQATGDQATGDQGSAQGPARAAVVAVVGCTLLVTLLVAWAATIGPGQVLDGHGAGLPDFTTTPTPTDPSATASSVGGDPPPPSGETPLLVKMVAIVLEVAAAAALLAGLFLAGRYLWGLRIRRRERPLEADFEVLAAPQRVTEAIVGDSAEQRRLLLSGDPRNGIVECWNRFEVQAGLAGVPRRSWETSSEYTLRCLDLVDADDGAVSRLAALFRESRFSEHEVTEDARAHAVAALDRIHASLVSRPASGGAR